MKHSASIIIVLALSMGICTAQDRSYTVREQTVPATDTTSVLCIGNSFTYVYDTYNILTEIAWSQGHYLKIKHSCLGGYSFGCHLAEPQTLKMILTRSRKGYDVVFMQNQTSLNGFYAMEPKRFSYAMKDARELVRKIRVSSRNAKYFIESNWSYPKYNYGDFGSYEAFDNATLKGTEKIARACKATVSPVSIAFAVCRSRYPEIGLLGPDKHHQSMEGAYLKCCVNYLMLFGGNFTPETSACTLDKDVAKKLQECAYDAVKSYCK